MSISAFISELITSTVKNDLFRQVLDTEITERHTGRAADDVGVVNGRLLLFKLFN